MLDAFTHARTPHSLDTKRPHSVKSRGTPSLPLPCTAEYTQLIQPVQSILPGLGLYAAHVMAVPHYADASPKCRVSRSDVLASSASSLSRSGSPTPTPLQATSAAFASRSPRVHSKLSLLIRTTIAMAVEVEGTDIRPKLYNRGKWTLIRKRQRALQATPGPGTSPPSRAGLHSNTSGWNRKSKTSLTVKLRGFVGALGIIISVT